MQEPQDRFTPKELKELVSLGELKQEDLSLLHPDDAKIAAALLARSGDVPFKEGMRSPTDPTANIKANAPAAGLGAVVGTGSFLAPELIAALGPLVAKGMPPNVEKLGKEAFDAVGRGDPAGTTGNVIKQGATEALKGGDRATQVIFGGLNAVKDAYPAFKKPPVSPNDLLQLIKNIKDVSRGGFQGVVRRAASGK